MIGASSAIVTCQRSSMNGGATGPKTWAREPFIATAKVWIKPIMSEATKAPAREPSPPTTMTTKRIGPSSAAIEGCVTSAGPAITPARPASAAPAPNTSIKIRGTSWPSMATISGWVSAAWMTRPTRVLFSATKSAAKIAAAVTSMNMR